MYRYKAKIVKVVDGDTVDAVVDLGFTVSVKVRLRLYGIDTPELKGISTDQKTLARSARDYLEGAVLNEQVEIETVKTLDKYGRWLATIFLFGEINVNKMMVEEGLAVEYYGAKKLT